ncbi:hypothetical protein LFZ31_06560 [Salmonella enterica subsp. enterica serovar Newport str. S09097]|nr:hypothetical protein LFZ31_06560 [Salmonella enterica subsp. enterica serovar Newport str. S09097]
MLQQWFLIFMIFYLVEFLLLGSLFRDPHHKIKYTLITLLINTTLIVSAFLKTLKNFIFYNVMELKLLFFRRCCLKNKRKSIG